MGRPTPIDLRSLLSSFSPSMTTWECSRFYQAALAKVGVRLEGAPDPHRGLEMLDALDPHLVLLDLTMPGIDGMEVLHLIKNRNALARVVMVTGNYSIETAVKAIQEGAADFVCKPVSAEKLRQLVDETRAVVDLEQRAADLEQQTIEVYNLEGMIGRSPGMLELFDLVRRVAPHLRTALVTGETGTGKELVARALHNHSPRAKQRFAVFNCGALVEGLAESQLFGHRKGSFTGAINDQPGLFEWADGGTVFLDEIGDLALPTQSKLLRVLETGEIQKLGSPQPSRADVQVIAATSRELNADMKAGRFRPDLWYRLSMVHIHLPALARTERRYSASGLAFHEQFLYAIREGRSACFAKGGERPGCLLLARKCSGAAKRHRPCGDADSKQSAGYRGPAGRIKKSGKSCCAAADQSRGGGEKGDHRCPECRQE